MNVKPNKHKRISFNTATMASLGFIGPPKILGPTLNLAPPSPQINFFAQVSPLTNYFGLKFLGSPPPLKLGRAATMLLVRIYLTDFRLMFHS